MSIEETGESYRVRLESPSGFQSGSFRTITLRESPTVRAVIGRPRGQRTTRIQSLIFPRDEWDRASVRQWVKDHFGGRDGEMRKRISNPRRRRVINPRHRLRRNRYRHNPNYDPMQRVSEIYQEFLGREPDAVATALAPDDAPEYLAAVGIITQLVTDSGTYDFDVQDGFILCVDARGNMWAISETRLTPGAEFGEVHELSYVTQKDHIDGVVMEYYHTFGEDGGQRPVAFVDEDGFLRFAGGDYYITSAGIVN